MFDGKKFGQELVEIVKFYIDKRFGKVAELEARIDALDPNGVTKGAKPKVRVAAGSERT